MSENTLVIQSSKRIYVFVALIHKATSPEDFFLDPENFYLKWGKKIPTGEHYEIEIVQPGKEFFELNQLHIHHSAKTKKPFVCYPLAIPNLTKALELFRIWCFGTVGTLDFGVDLNAVYDRECASDPKRFFTVMGERYGIHVVDALLKEDPPDQILS